MVCHTCTCVSLSDSQDMTKMTDQVSPRVGPGEANKSEYVPRAQEANCTSR